MFPNDFCRLQKQIRKSKLDMHELTCWWLLPGTLPSSCRGSSGNCSVWRANSNWEQAARRLTTCCETKNFRINVTPSIMIDWTHVSPGITEGGSDCNLLLLGLTKTISADLARFNCRLLLHAQLPMLLSSDEQEWILLAGIIKYPSSAILHTSIWSLFGNLAGDQMLWWHKKQDQWQIPE